MKKHVKTFSCLRSNEKFMNSNFMSSCSNERFMNSNFMSSSCTENLVKFSASANRFLLCASGEAGLF